MAYLDYNATAPILPEVKAAMVKIMGEALNPSSIHAAGRLARKMVEEARQEILSAVNGGALVFCGSGTEANNLALRQGNEIAISAIEHESIYKTVPQAQIIRVTENGVIDLEHLNETLNSEIDLISIMLANNETGIIQPVKKAAKMAHAKSILVHCDAVQGFGKIPIDFKDLDVDLMTISSHKVGGPVGTAALIHRRDLEIRPLMYGGSQEKNKRPGTENVTAIAGFAEMAKNVSRETSSRFRDYLEKEIIKIASNSIIYGNRVERLPNTSCIAMPEIASSTQLIHFDSNNIAVSAGSACSSGKVEVSRVLKAMNAPLAGNAIRVSTGWATTKQDIDNFIKSWRDLYFRSNR